jgi:ATP phosphoribosyltransferase
VVLFIVLPKNSGLSNCREIILSCLNNSESSKIIEVRGEDVPFWIELLQSQGKDAVGITGEDLYVEYCLAKGRNTNIIRKIPWSDKKALFSKPALCLLGPSGRKLSELPKTLTICITSKYKQIASQYLNDLELDGYCINKLYVNGSAELMFVEGIADLVIDIVYSGSSMKEAGLEVYDKIIASDFVVIGGTEKSQFLVPRKTSFGGKK